MSDFAESGSRYGPAPALVGIISAVALAAPAFLIITARIGTEQYAARFDCCPKFFQNPWQFLTRDVKKRRVGKNPIEIFRRQPKSKEILKPYVAAAVALGQFDKTCGSIQPDGFVSQIFEYPEVPPGPAAEIENPKRPAAGQILQQGVAILTHVMIACAFPETFRMQVIMGERDG